MQSTVQQNNLPFYCVNCDARIHYVNTVFWCMAECTVPNALIICTNSSTDWIHISCRGGSRTLLEWHVVCFGWCHIATTYSRDGQHDYHCYERRAKQSKQPKCFVFHRLFPSRRLHFFSIIVCVSADEVSALESCYAPSHGFWSYYICDAIATRYGTAASRRNKQREFNNKKARRMKKIINCSCKSEWMHH